MIPLEEPNNNGGGIIIPAQRDDNYRTRIMRGEAFSL